GTAPRDTAPQNRTPAPWDTNCPPKDPKGRDPRPPRARHPPGDTAVPIVPMPPPTPLRWRPRAGAQRPPRPCRAEFRAEVLQKKREERLIAEGLPEELEEHRRLMAWNEEENGRQRARRSERLRREEEEQKRRKSEIAEKQAKKMEAFLEEKEKEVLQLQEEAKNFITPENLEARIEECLDNPRNYNFAINKDGRVVKRTVLS
uniref:Small ribosomal subunit protein mS26 n=1 Tax=Junco hyemalis TaxID=40217 RepID=A0A8C5IK22_JUNHY